jgi:hypothetical protein
MAHRNWIERFGLPTKEQADMLRVCYKIGNTTTEEWATIQSYIVPAHLRPESSDYRVLLKDLFWSVYAATGDEIAKHDTRIDAWAHVDRLRLLDKPKHPSDTEAIEVEDSALKLMVKAA